jgi:hypothetical protein
MRWTGHIALMGEMKSIYKIVVGKSEWKRPLGRPRRGWEDNIRKGLRVVGWDSVKWIYLAHDKEQWRAVVNTVVNLWIP